MIFRSFHRKTNQLIELNTQSFLSWFTDQVSFLSFISLSLLWEWFATLNSHHASVRVSIKRHERLSELHHISQIVQAYMLTCWSSSIFWMISVIYDQSSSLNKVYEYLYFAKALCLSFESSQLYDEHYNTLLVALLLAFIVSLNVLWYFVIILLTS